MHNSARPEELRSEQRSLQRLLHVGLDRDRLLQLCEAVKTPQRDHAFTTGSSLRSPSTLQDQDEQRTHEGSRSISMNQHPLAKLEPSERERQRERIHLVKFLAGISFLLQQRRDIPQFLRCQSSI